MTHSTTTKLGYKIIFKRLHLFIGVKNSGRNVFSFLPLPYCEIAHLTSKKITQILGKQCTNPSKMVLSFLGNWESMEEEGQLTKLLANRWLEKKLVPSISRQSWKWETNSLTPMRMLDIKYKSGQTAAAEHSIEGNRIHLNRRNLIWSWMHEMR